MATEFDFDDDSPREFLVCYRGSRYVLTEASEGAAINFRNASLKGASFQMSGQSVNSARMEGGAEAQVVLLSGCLFHTDPDPDAPDHLRDKDGRGWKVKYDPKTKTRVNVPQAELKSWGSKVTKPLFERAKEISDLGEKDKSPAAEVSTLTAFDPDDNGVSAQPNYPAELDPKGPGRGTPSSP